MSWNTQIIQGIQIYVATDGDAIEMVSYKK